MAGWIAFPCTMYHIQLDIIFGNVFFLGPDGTGLQIDNEVDIRRFDNSEIAMRLTTDMKTGDYFATDLNGFQMIKRKRLDKLPIQANYYPIPSMAYIQVWNCAVYCVLWGYNYRTCWIFKMLYFRMYILIKRYANPVFLGARFPG